MKHRTIFRIALRWLGLLLIGFGVPAFAQTIVEFTYYSLERNALMPRFTLGLVSAITAATLRTLFGLYLLFDARWLLDRFAPIDAICPECGYDLSKTTGPSCPECGLPVPERAGPGSSHAP